MKHIFSCKSKADMIIMCYRLSCWNNIIKDPKAFFFLNVLQNLFNTKWGTLRKLRSRQQAYFHWCWASLVSPAAPCNEAESVFAYMSILNGHGHNLHCALCGDAYNHEVLNLVPSVCHSFLSSYNAKCSRCCKSQEQTISCHIYILKCHRLF